MELSMADASAKIPLADIPEGKMHACSIGGREIVVCHTKDGFFALDNVCTHAYARLSEGRLRGTRLICPLHGAGFDVRDGRALGAPATRAVATHAVQIVDSMLEVTMGLSEATPG
jgi:nitrite reductase/ring-hydroxylating ferredoxin subunit